MTKQKNVRSLDTIADNINQLQRGNIIEIGDLLLEAKAQCEHGGWLNWLDIEFDWSVDTAERYMAIAELASKFRSVRNLKLAATTLYGLANRDEENLPAIIAELAKHSIKTRLAPRDAERIIKIGIGRHRFGDYPDVTLFHLTRLDRDRGEPWYGKAVATLQKRKPETDEEANSIINEIEKEYDVLYVAEQEAEAILDGAAPDLPPPTTPPEPQRLAADTAWVETGVFADAVTGLRELRAKPVARFVGMFSPAELREVSEFLAAVAAADQKDAA
jgi:hypothetical protein